MFLGKNHPKGTREQFPGGILSGGSYLWGNFLGAIIQEAIIRGAIIRDGGSIFLGYNCPGCNFPRGQFSVAQ